LKSCSGVPETITSDCGPQFTSNLWFQLCEMLNISHKQATAYHPESNGAVERLHRCLKDALCARAATATWSEELPFVLLGLRAQLREDTSLSLAEAVFGAQIVLPNKFLQSDDFSVDAIVKKFSTTLHVSAPSLPRDNSSTDLPSELPAELLSAPLVWVCRAAWFHPFSRSTTAPTKSCTAAPTPSPSESGRGTRWLPSAASRLARPRTPLLEARVAAADHRVRTQAVLPQPSGLIFRPAGFFTFFAGAATRRFRNCFPTRRGGFCMPGTGGAITGATDAVPVPSMGTATEVGPLTSSPPSRGQSSGGALWTSAYIPGNRLASWMYSTNYICAVPVYKLLFIRQ
jgi:hypothetical protein